MMSPMAPMTFNGSMPRATPRVRDTTITSDTPKTQNVHVGTASNEPTIAFTTKYMKNSTPAHPNSSRQSRLLILHTPFHIRANIRWLTPIVKQRNIMLW